MDKEKIYRERIEIFQKKSARLKKVILWVSLLRFFIFITAVIVGWLLFSVNRNAFFYSIFGSVALFLAVLAYHEKLIKRKDFTDRLITINKDEIRALRRIYTPFDSGAEYQRHQDIHLADLDVFGKNSLFHMINRTVTLSGSRRLALWFRFPHQRPEDILRRQEVVKELCDDLDFRQNFRATALHIHERKGDYIKLLRWLNEKPVYSGKPIFPVLIIAVPAVNILTTILWMASLLPWQWPTGFLLATFVFLGFFLAGNNAVHQSLTKYSSVIFKYSDLLKLFENKSFTSKFMNGLQEEMSLSGKKAWAVIEDLGKIIKMLDQRLNMLMGVLLNVYLLWDIRQIMRLEKWRQQNANEMVIWLNNLGYADAFCSLANLAFNEPLWSFPRPQTEILLEGREMRHPLMARDRCVPNDIFITKAPHFKIITGANMAGKSTYLRTTGSLLLLAMIGAPVPAKSLIFKPVNIATSLRTTDSLLKNESYFYAELKRLHDIIERLKNGENLMVFLDEILKGTNSKDKEAGSVALLKQLISLNGYGLIATHDLQLARVAGHFKKYTENMRFEADIQGDKLIFDYRIKPGIAQNLNATFLMKKMGITID